MFNITDSNYGRTLAVYECVSCGFRQCHDIQDVTQYYATLQDEAYEESSGPRILQVNKILDEIQPYVNQGVSLLDVGAGLGFLVKAAKERGFIAEGVEPSKWLSDRGRAQGLTLHTGTIDSLPADRKYNIITCIDVIEHVTAPMELMNKMKSRLTDSGIMVIVTPDAGSVAARLLGFKWWHYRIAHVGYFKKKHLTLALEKIDMDILKFKRPTWYFPLSYLIERVICYMPKWFKLPSFKVFQRFTIPLNLFDSWLVIARNHS